MSDRGEYRSIYASMLDDPDFRDMPGDDFKLLFAIKLSLGPAGIGVLRKLVLCEQLGISPRKLEKGLESLEKPKPDSEIGWIVRDKRRDIVWIVNALKYEPALSSKNSKHRKFVAALLSPLSDNSHAVQQFWTMYAEWRTPNDNPSDTDPDGSPYPIEGVSDGYPNPIDRVSKHKDERRETRDERRETVTRKTTDERRKPPVDRLLDRFYSRSPAKRRAEVRRQLEQTLTTEGVRWREQIVRANSQGHLNRCISDVLRGKPPEDHDKAITFVFTKLLDPETDSKGRTSLEAESAARRQSDNMFDRWSVARDRAVERWLKANVREAEQIERMVKASTDNEFSFSGRLLTEFTKAAGFPEFEVWEQNKAVPA